MHHKPLAPKTITSNSIYTASNYFNDSINNHFALARNSPLVFSILLSFDGKEEENVLRMLLFKGRQTNELKQRQRVMWDFTAHTGKLLVVNKSAEGHGFSFSALAD